MATGDKLVTLDGLKAVHDRDMQTLDVKYRFANTDFNYGELKVGGINKDNAYTSGTNQRRVETYWPVIDDEITIQMSGGLTGYLRLYDSNKTMIDPDASLPGANTTNHYVLIGKNESLTLRMKDYNVNAAYFRFTMLSGTEEIAEALIPENARFIMPKNVATQEDVDELQNKNMPNIWGLFRNAVCIGDSLTRGYLSAYASKERNRDYGYPSALARLTGMNVWNYGLSGSDPGEWAADATMAAQNYSKFDVAFVSFGQNIDKSGGGSYTESEYEELYMSVLQRLKTANSNMVIFCLSNPGPRAVNGWIQDFVATATNQSGTYAYQYVYYLDVSTDAPYTSHRTDGTHLDALGYSMLAECVKIAVEKLYAQNPTAVYIPKTVDNIITKPVNPPCLLEDKVEDIEDSVETLESDVSDLKSAISGVVGVNNLFNSTIEHAEFFKKIQNTINVSSTNWITIAPESQVIVNCTQNEKFIVLAKLKSNVSQDYVYRVRLRKYDSSGSTGVYYYSDDFYSSIMAQITASGSGVTQVALQLVRQYTGSAENNFSETFDLEYLILIRGDITLSDLVKTHFSIDDIPDGSISPAKLTPLTDRYDMILRSGVKCPNYDTVNHQLTIYRNTVIVDLLDNTELIRLDADVVLDAPSTAQVSELSYATTTGVFQLLGQGKQYTSRIYLGSINRTSGLGHLKCAYTINGYPIGSDLLLADIAEKLPNNWVSKIEEINTAKTNKFTFAVQTDTHYVLDDDVNYGNNLKSLTNHVGFDFVVNMGDVIQGYADEIINNPANSRSAMTQIMHRYVTGISCPLLIAMGNHDTNKLWANAYGGNPFSFDEVWGREFRPAFNTNPKAEFKTGIMYYYTDFNDIRVIVLNTQDGADGGFGIGQAQIEWLTNTALDTDKAVLIVSHVPLINGWSVSSNYVSSYANAVAAIKAFQVNGGTVIGCFSGHTHTQEAQKVDGLLYVTFQNGGSRAEVVMIDLENKIVDTIPVGFTGVGNRSFTF